MFTSQCTLLKIWDSYWCNLAGYMRRIKTDHSHAVTRLFSRKAGNSLSSCMQSNVLPWNKQTVVRDGYRPVIMDEGHRHQAVTVLKKEANYLWLDKYIHVQDVKCEPTFHIRVGESQAGPDGILVYINNAQERVVCEHRERASEPRQGASLFRLQYCMLFNNIRTTDILHNIVSYKYFSTKRGGTHNRPVPFANLLIKPKNLLHTLQNVSTWESEVKSLVASQIDSLCYFFSRMPWCLTWSCAFLRHKPDGGGFVPNSCLYLMMLGITCWWKGKTCLIQKRWMANLASFRLRKWDLTYWQGHLKQ